MSDGEKTFEATDNGGGMGGAGDIPAAVEDEAVEAVADEIEGTEQEEVAGDDEDVVHVEEATDEDHTGAEPQDEDDGAGQDYGDCPGPDSPILEMAEMYVCVRCGGAWRGGAEVMP